MKIEILRKRVKIGRYEISLHAEKERRQELEEAIASGEIIEKYPEDPRGPSCLILGYSEGKPMHIVCGILPAGWLRIITVYIPKPPKWINPKQRRPE